MSSLTQSQADLLEWMVESDSNTFVLTETWGPQAFLKAVDAGTSLDVNANDVRELEHQGLVRPATGKSYEVTNDGRLAYDQWKNPRRLRIQSASNRRSRDLAPKRRATSRAGERVWTGPKWGPSQRQG